MLATQHLQCKNNCDERSDSVGADIKLDTRQLATSERVAIAVSEFQGSRARSQNLTMCLRHHHGHGLPRIERLRRHGVGRRHITSSQLYYVLCCDQGWYVSYDTDTDDYESCELAYFLQQLSQFLIWSFESNNSKCIVVAYVSVVLLGTSEIENADYKRGGMASI